MYERLTLFDLSVGYTCALFMTSEYTLHTWKGTPLRCAAPFVSAFHSIFTYPPLCNIPFLWCYVCLTQGGSFMETKRYTVSTYTGSNTWGIYSPPTLRAPLYLSLYSVEYYHTTTRNQKRKAYRCRMCGCI
jgi:hypothetical protein